MSKFREPTGRFELQKSVISTGGIGSIISSISDASYLLRRSSWKSQLVSSSNLDETEDDLEGSVMRRQLSRGPSQTTLSRATSTRKVSQISSLSNRSQHYLDNESNTSSTSSKRGSIYRRCSAAIHRQPKNMYQLPLDSDDFKLPVYYHNHDDERTLTSSLKINFIFSSLKDHEIKSLLHAFEPCEFKKGEVIIQQGDVGDYFYILNDGKVRFTVNDITVGETSEKGASFGELALLYSCPRAATVIAENNINHLLRVDQRTFRLTLRNQTERSTQDKKTLLKSIPFLENVPNASITKLAHNMTPRIFKQDEVLVRKGDIGDKFYVIQEGALTCKDITVGNKSYEDLPLGPGDYFGERALITSEPRVANVVSISKGIAFTIDKTTFEKVFGKMSALMMKVQDIRSLAGVPFIKHISLTEDQLDAIASQIVEVNYKAGDVVIQEGSRVKGGIYIVRSGGELRLKSEDNSTDEVVSGGGYFGDVLAETSLNKKDGMVESPYTVTALKDTTCGIVSIHDCLYIIAGDIELAACKRESFKWNIRLENLQKLDILGEGTFGQVWLVKDSKSESSPAYALKIQSKHELVKEGQATAAIREKKILDKLRHPFIARLVNSYQDDYFIYVLLDAYQGGELFSLLHESDNDLLAEDQAKFYSYAIADALVYMNQRRYVYRDLKPENVMIDDRGYPVLVDFGFAKHVPELTFTICGTPGYISPECLLQRGYDVSADHWAIGILIYEMITGANPFFINVNMNQMELFKRIIKDQYKPPVFVSEEAKDIVAQLLIKDAAQRLGSLARGPSEILDHPWFNEIDIEALRAREITSPWVPDVEDQFDLSYFNDWSGLQDKTTLPQTPISSKHANLFKDF